MSTTSLDGPTLERVAEALHENPAALFTAAEMAALARTIVVADIDNDLFADGVEAVRSWATRTLALLEPSDRAQLVADHPCLDRLDPNLVRIGITQALRRLDP